MSLIVTDRSQWALPLLLRTRAADLGERPYLSFAVDDAALTYSEADRASDRLAAGFARLGIGEGDRVLLMLGNRVEFVLAWFAANKLGAAVVPINVDYRGDFLEHLANTAEAATMVLEARYVDVVLASRPHLRSLRTLVVAGAPADTPPEVPGFDVHAFADVPEDTPPPAPAVRPRDTASILFTSGTTGRSKGAVIPHAHAHLLCERNRELLDMDADSVYATELPLFHINAQMTVYSTLIAGGQGRIEERFSASRWLDRIRASGATHTSMLGVMVEFVMAQAETEHDGDHRLRSVWSVPCLPEQINRFRERFDVARIVCSYGTTETGMLTHRVVEPGTTDPSAGPVATDFYDIRIADEHGAFVPAGEPGEILVRPRLPWTSMQGYFGMPERTVEAMRDLFLRTGDVGRIDERGHLWFLDRLQDRIRRRGENVASADVEHVLASHAAVSEAAVVAVSADEVGGEDELKACLVLAAGAELDVEAFWAWCDERLPYFAVPRYVDVLPALPRTATEKIIKHELRATGVGPATHDRGPGGRVRP